jgi:hypothetical protein
MHVLNRDIREPLLRERGVGLRLKRASKSPREHPRGLAIVSGDALRYERTTVAMSAAWDDGQCEEHPLGRQELPGSALRYAILEAKAVPGLFESVGFPAGSE